MDPADKKSLRQTLLKARKAMDGVEKAALDTALCQAIAAHCLFTEAKSLLAFSPIKGEPDLSPLIQTAFARHMTVALPRCVGNTMAFFAITPKTVLDFDEFGIPAPPACAPRFLPDKDTLCLLPGLAADSKGNRLGYGGGFYDRFLADYPGKTIFPLYHRFLLPHLPTASHDRGADLIVTEKGVFLPC